MLKPSLAGQRRRSLGGALAPPVLSSGPNGPIAQHVKARRDAREQEAAKDLTTQGSDDTLLQTQNVVTLSNESSQALQEYISRQLQDLIAPLEAQIAEVEGNRDAQQAENRALQAATSQLELQLGQMEAERKQLEPVIAKLHESVSNVRSAIEDDSNTLVEKKHALAVLEAQLERTRKESSDTLVQALDAHRQAGTHASTLDSLQQLLKRSKEGSASSGADYLKLIAKKDRMKREKEEQQSAIDGSLADMRRMRSEHKEIRDSVTRTAQKKDQMKKSVARLEQRLGRLKAALKEQRQLQLQEKQTQKPQCYVSVDALTPHSDAEQRNFDGFRSDEEHEDADSGESTAAETPISNNPYSCAKAQAAAAGSEGPSEHQSKAGSHASGAGAADRRTGAGASTSAAAVAGAAADTSDFDKRAAQMGRSMVRVHLDNPVIRWKRGELLGEGAFAKVYLGINEDTGELLAVKELKPRGGEGTGASNGGSVDSGGGTSVVSSLDHTAKLLGDDCGHDVGGGDGRDDALGMTGTLDYVCGGDDSDLFAAREGNDHTGDDRDQNDESMDVDVPSPTPSPKHSDNSDQKRPSILPTRLEDQIAVLRDLTHPNIVRYVGTQREKLGGGDVGTTRFIFLEYVSGGSIKSLLSKFGCLTLPVVRGYTRQMFMGLEYLHARCIIHGDIKAANVLVNETGVVKLADFGCAQQFDGMSSVDEGSNALNRSGHQVMLGSVPWMAPEVLRQSTHGRKADIWSCGCTVIEMLTCSHPWTNFTNQMALMYHVATTKELPPFPDSLTDEGLQFLRHCFVREPSERWSAAQLLGHAFLPASRRSMHARG